MADSSRLWKSRGVDLVVAKSFPGKKPGRSAIRKKIKIEDRYAREGYRFDSSEIDACRERAPRGRPGMKKRSKRSKREAVQTRASLGFGGRDFSPDELAAARRGFNP